ncbi:MAG TPA: PKD domain-containing protein, partial [Armatimonadota bacterium]|nr:PKD domain-containing protein [Armatimonadota bacterium]
EGGAMGPGGMMPGGGMMGEGGVMAPGAGGQATEKEDAPRKIANIRALLVTSEGLIDSGAIPVGEHLGMNAETSDNEGWVRVSVRLSEFAGTADKAGATLEQFALFGDQKGKYYIGAMRIVQEDEPMKADAGPDRVVRVGQSVTFNAAAQLAGQARYSWDFDDLVDGVAEDALGEKTSFTFEEAGFYKITLTVTDPDGNRIPQVDRINVTVQ